ncbi:hypothetical protein H2198_007706 [Neophaeococcomyces mojaviensis]|uniref:Uncharacterized protein n=1 Tax=Neophaeococcomyces mojaviensis TaxID=3383035 RepID=A0ACC2ZZR7_9EURO|nr:hypothetical protein H2198_007706 [Knufia sp. JES_112]
MDKFKIFLTTQDPYGIYGPGDKLRGTANLFTPEALVVRSIRVICSAACRVHTFDQQKKLLKSATQVLFTKSVTVYERKKQESSRHLSPGDHKWNYSCALPSSNRLPPSFDYRDHDGTAEVLYVVVMRVDSSSLASDRSHCYLKFKYSPRRASFVDADEPLSQLSASLLVKRREKDKIPGWKKCIPDAIRKRLSRRDVKHESFRVVLLLPRYAAFSEHMDISIKVETVPKGLPLGGFDLTLAEVKYQLWASTRVAFDRTSRARQHLVQQESVFSVSRLSANNHWLSLRRWAPFRVQPRLYGMPLDKDSFSTVGPSFGTQNIVREYKLDIILLITAWGKNYRVTFEDNEMIVLPHEMHSLID